jgi:cell wall-associated NlpC family hydrolase
MVRFSTSRAPRVRRSASLIVAAVATLVALLPAQGSATPIDDKRAEAARIQDRLDALNQELSARDEQVNQAQLELDAATAKVEEAKQRIASVTGERDSARSAFDQRVAELYVGASSPNPVTFLQDATRDDVGARLVYGDLLADGHIGDVQRLTVLQGDLDAEQAVLEQAEQVAQAKLREVQDGQAQLQELVGQQQAVLQTVQGELAQLVAAEEARRRAEEERLARERYQAQLAAEQARAQQQAEARRQAAAAQAEARRQAAARTTTAPTTAPAADPAPTATNAPGNAPANVDGGGGGGGGGSGSAVVDAARKYLGIPYRYGGSGPNNFDCSGLTAYVYREFGVNLPHSAEWQYTSLPHVSRDSLQPGDLVFFGSPIHHVGIYVGNGQMLDAPHTGTVVQIRTMLRNDYVGAARPQI